MSDRLDFKKKQNIGNLRGSISLVLFYLIFPVVLICSFHSSFVYAQSRTDNPKRVLVVCSHGYGLHGYDVVVPAIRSSLEFSGFNAGDFYVEFMDLLRSKDEDARPHLADYFRQKYSTVNFDLIVTIQLPALLFFLNEGKDLWPDASLLAKAIPDPDGVENTAGRRVVIYSLSPDIEGTLKLALAMFPGTKRVVYVNGVSEEEKRAQRVAESVFSQWRNRLEFESTSNLTIDETIQRLSNLPDGAIVIYIALLIDKTGRAIMSKDIARLLSRNANVPIFASFSTVLGAGVIGGSLTNLRDEGTRIGQMAVDILKGKLVPTDQITVLSSSKVPMFDWEQIEKWKVDESRLPAGSIFVNRPQSVWDHYRWHIIGSFTILLAQSLLIIGLLIHKRQRRWAEELLREAEEKYRNIFEGALEGIYETSPEGKNLTANPALAKMLGYDSPQEVVSSVTDSGRQVWGDPNERLHYIRLLDEHGVILNYECEHYRKDRTKIWVSLNSRRVQGPMGQTLCYSGFIEDISERKQAEDKLRESEMRLKIAMDMAKLVQWEYDLKTDMFSFDEQFYALYGTTSQYEGGPFMTSEVYARKFIPPEESHVVAREISKALETIDPDFIHQLEHRIIRADGQERHIIVRYVVVCDEAGRVVKTRGVNQDVTELKLAEKQLRDSEVKFRSYIEASPLAIFVADRQGRLVDFNPMAVDLLGYDAATLKKMHILDLHPDEDGDEVLREFSSLLEAGHVEIERRMKKCDGQPIWVSLHATMTSDGVSLGYCEDISDRKWMEEQLQGRLREIEKLKKQLEQENISLREEVKFLSPHAEIVAASPAMQQVMVHVEQVAPTDSTVLISGETGTGKEVIARAIHKLSVRKGLTLVTVNCASLPPTLIESELFGRERGAFTGAMSRMAGRFEIADGSTLFLDEIGDLPLEVQAKLLRVLEEGRFERLGSTKSLKVNVRIIAATNRNLDRMIQTGEFRKDLLYRLKVFPIVIPPLRERQEDIPLLTWAFIRQFEKRMARHIESIPKRSLDALLNYSWPGNARELRNVVEHAMIVSRGTVLEVRPPVLVRKDIPGQAENLQDVERQHIVRILEERGWRVAGAGGAAEILGLKPTTLEARMKKLGIRRPNS